EPGTSWHHSFEFHFFRDRVPDPQIDNPGVKFPGPCERQILLCEPLRSFDSNRGKRTMDARKTPRIHAVPCGQTTGCARSSDHNLALGLRFPETNATIRCLGLSRVSIQPWMDPPSAEPGRIARGIRAFPA